MMINNITRSESLQLGINRRKRFVEQIKRVSRIKGDGVFRHSYIYSPPGIGKSHTIENYLNLNEVKYIKIKGNVSMYAFGIQLAVINYNNPNKEKIVVFVDDCDSLFATEESCNTMKSVLDGVQTFNYEKSLQSQWSSLNDLQKESVRFHQKEDNMGFSVPTDNLTFIFASNFKLPIDDDIKKLRHKSTTRAILLSHKNAIRSRCNVGDYDLHDEELWGWIADVVLHTECLSKYNVTDIQKEEILTFLWEHWNSLTERSIRLVLKMTEILCEYPNDYKSIWEMDYLK